MGKAEEQEQNGGEGGIIENWEELEEKIFKQNGEERAGGRSRMGTSGGAGAESGAEWGEESQRADPALL